MRTEAVLLAAYIGLGTGTAAGRLLPAPYTVTRSDTVAVRIFQFAPDTLHVRPGARVVWLNGDPITHSVVGGAPDDPRPWANAPMQGKGDAVSLRFPRPGTYPYHCGRHPAMRGVVHVSHVPEEKS